MSPMPPLPEDSRVCPGSVFVRASDGNCHCGYPLHRHLWREVNGTVTRVEEPTEKPSAGASPSYQPGTLPPMREKDNNQGGAPMTQDSGRFLRPIEQESPLASPAYEVYVDGQKVGSISQRPSGWWTCHLAHMTCRPHEEGHRAAAAQWVAEHGRPAEKTRHARYADLRRAGY